MKRNILIGGVVAALLAPAMVSCSSDYLDEKPLTAPTSETVKTTEAGAIAAVTGLARHMERQLSELKNGNLNASGETFFANLYGEGLGCDANIGEITNYASSSCNPDNLRGGTSWWASWMYRYAYGIVGSANQILAGLDSDEPEDAEMWAKACALTFRAHAYWRLMEVYGPRWADSQNGEAYALVLRLQPVNTQKGNNHPLNTCNEIYNQLYSDLREALELFDKTDLDRGSDLFLPDASVAAGVFARIAMLKNDYKTAQEMANKARKGYELMTPDAYKGGFATANSETIWGQLEDATGIYYWGFGPHYACNGHYVISWGYSDSMDYSLYRQMSPSDVRAELYFGPMLIDINPKMAEKYKITKDDFFNKEVYLQTKLGISITGTGDKPVGKNLDMWNFIMAYGKTFASLRPTDIKGIYLTNAKGISMGVQYKFQGLPDGYTSCFPAYMRASEMLLTEAEAAYHNGDVATATACLKELMAQRDANYSFDGTGEALYNEIKLQRRIELWGEGFCWFDFKRWNVPMERIAWDPKNPETCGNWPKTLARKFETNYMNGWRAAIPQAEFDINEEAIPSLVGQ